MSPTRQSGELQDGKRKGIVRVQSTAKRRRVGSLTTAERRRIVFLFDQSHGDADYAAERCEVIGIQRADVLAVVLAETRSRGPQPETRLSLLGAVA